MDPCYPGESPDTAEGRPPNPPYGVISMNVDERSLVAADPTAADQRSLHLRIGVEQRTEADRVLPEVESV